MVCIHQAESIVALKMSDALRVLLEVKVQTLQAEVTAAFSPLSWTHRKAHVVLYIYSERWLATRRSAITLPAHVCQNPSNRRVDALLKCH